MKGPARLSEVPGAPPRPLAELVSEASATTKATKGMHEVQLKNRPKKKKRKGAPSPGEPRKKRKVLVKLTEEDEKAMRWPKKGVKVLEDKWKGLYIVDPATGFSGEIDCFMWNKASAQVAVCSAHGSVEPKCYQVPELPAMVWAARHEQPAHVILEGDPDAVDEFDVPGDGEAEELRRLAEPDDEEDEMDTT